MKLLYLLWMFVFFPLTYAAEFWENPEFIQAQKMIADLLGEQNFDNFQNKLDNIDASVLKHMSRVLCENALCVKEDERFILALLEREADLGISLEDWAEMILTVSKDSLRKKLVISKHPQKEAIKYILLEKEADSLADSCRDYSTGNESIILDKLEANLAAQEETRSKVVQFFENNKTSLSLAAGSIIVLIAWKWRSKNNTQNNSSIN